MRFVKIVNNTIIYDQNKLKIINALKDKKINSIQAKLLDSNNFKYYGICKHKGLLEIQNNKILFVPRTSWELSLNRPRTLDDLKYSNKVLSKEKIEFIKFNELCNIGNLKWVLGNENDDIEFQDFEGRPDVIAKLIGTKKDLIEFKEWVSNQNLEHFDISPYFNLDDTIDELTIFNSFIKDE